MTKTIEQIIEESFNEITKGKFFIKLCHKTKNLDLDMRIKLIVTKNEFEIIKNEFENFVKEIKIVQDFDYDATVLKFKDIVFYADTVDNVKLVFDLLKSEETKTKLIGG